MNILFAHRTAPGQFRHAAAALAADPANRVVFLARDPAEALPGVDLRLYEPHRAAGPATHPYARPFEEAVLHGQAACRLAHQLRREGFVPDLMVAHAGFGPGLYLKETFPDSPLLSYFEWFYRARGGDAEFLCGPLHPDDACRVHTLNAPILLELAACDWGLCPTAFQLAQFPEGFRGKLTRLHDGVDTAWFSPAPDAAPRRIPGLDLPEPAEVVVYATRGMDPYRGFPQFMRAAAILLERRPNLHVLVGGADETPYGPRRRDGRTWREAMLEELAGRDLSRLRFTGPLEADAWRDLLRGADALVHLTVPFALSWSLLEAMATGCAIVGSDTAPVREAMDDGVHGLLADFHAPAAIAAAVERLLDDGDLRRRLGAAARARALAEYALADLLPRRLRLIRRLAASRAALVDA